LIKVSDELRALLNSGSVPLPKIKIKVGSYIFGYDDETCSEHPIENNNILSVNIHYMGALDDYPLGTANSSYVEVELWDVESGVVFSGKELKLYVGYEINSVIEWVNAGTFFPEKPSRSGKITSFTAYDRMKNLTSIYIPSFNKNTNHSIAEYLTDIANQFGFVFKAAEQLLAQTKINSDLFIPSTKDESTGEDVISGYSAQNCIAYLAGAAGCNAMFNRNDELQLYSFSKAYFDDDEQYEVSDDNTDNPSVSEFNQVIQFVSCNNGETNLITSENNTNQTGVSIENPLIKTKDHLDSVYSSLSETDDPFSYRVISLNYLTGDITLECFDVIRYSDIDNDTYQFPLMSLNFVYDGGITCLMCSFGKTFAETQNEVSTIQSITAEVSKLKTVSEIISQRVEEQQNILSRTQGGHALLVDLKFNTTTKKYYVGNDEATTLVVSENPAVATQSEPNDWSTGRVIKIDYNGITVSATGIAGPYKDFALYYSESKSKYLINADDISVGTLQGIEAILDKGTIGGFTIGTWKDSSGKQHEGLKKTFKTGNGYTTFAIDGTSGSTTANYLMQIFASDVQGNAASGEYSYAVDNDGSIECLDLYVKGKLVRAGECLWSGAYYMSASQTVSLSKPVSEQTTGIELVFAPYKNGAIVNNNWVHFQICKEFIAYNAPSGNRFIMVEGNFENIATKVLYISDYEITGSSNNTAKGTANGITYNNGSFVLTSVWGI
jgi:hypothetical protein